MRADSVLVIDAGTSALRATLVGPDGATQEIGREPWRMLRPEDAAPFGRELAADEVTASLWRLLDAAAPQRDRIAAVSVTGQREGLAFVDESGEAVYVGPNVDARASAEGMLVDARHAARVYEATGHLPSLMQAGAKYAWLRANRTADTARVRHALPLADWLIAAMTGALHVSRSLGIENGLLDVRTGGVAADVLALFDAGASIVPRAVDEGAVAGEVRGGPLAGVRVVHAGADTQCALLGMDVAAPGECGIVAGWSAPAQLVTDEPVIDGERRTWTGRHVVPQRYVLESNAGDAGRAWDWVCRFAGLQPREAETSAESAQPGANDVLAILTAPVMDAARMNAGTGAILIPLPLVMSEPERGDVLRAVLEGVAYAVRANVEQLEAVSAMRIPRVALCGGMATGGVFGRILCDVLDREVVLHGSDATALGAAALAQPTSGFAESAEPAATRSTLSRATLTPQARTSAMYDDCYERWRAMAEMLREAGGAA